MPSPMLGNVDDARWYLVCFRPTIAVNQNENENRQIWTHFGFCNHFGFVGNNGKITKINYTIHLQAINITMINKMLLQTKMALLHMIFWFSHNFPELKWRENG